MVVKDRVSFVWAPRLLVAAIRVETYIYICIYVYIYIYRCPKRTMNLIVTHTHINNPKPSSCISPRPFPRSFRCGGGSVLTCCLWVRSRRRRARSHHVVPGLCQTPKAEILQEMDDHSMFRRGYRILRILALAFMAVRVTMATR